MDASIREGRAAASPPPSARTKPLPSFDRSRFRRLFLAVVVPMFLAAVDQTLLATATPVISRELGGLLDTSAAWAAGRVPALRFDGEQSVTSPPVE